jgi:hypothetical protein
MSINAIFRYLEPLAGKEKISVISSGCEITDAESFL